MRLRFDRFSSKLYSFDVLLRVDSACCGREFLCASSSHLCQTKWKWIMRQTLDAAAAAAEDMWVFKLQSVK